jgi:small subunit ribosomal protein S21
MPSVDCKNMPTHRALRIFKRKCDNAGILLEVRKRQSYEKPSAKRQRLKNAARRRNQKEISKQKLQSEEVRLRQRLYR